MLPESDRYWRSRCAEIRVVDASGVLTEPAFLELPRAPERLRYPTNRVLVVEAGETWFSLSFDYLGDARHWKILADFSEIIDPFEEFEPGDLVVVPADETVHFIILGGGNAL